MKNVLINSILLIVSLFFSIIILESGLRYHYKSNRVIPSAQDFAIYDSLGIKNHHIREFTNHTGEKRNPEKYYYSSYLLNGKGEKLLIQGDSWMEQLDVFNELEPMLSQNTNVSMVVNGGATSYSPSLMEVQYNDIIEETNLDFDLILAYIDQTDFMDEVCMYNKMRIEDDSGSLLLVLKDTAITGSRYANSSQGNMLTLANSASYSMKLLTFLHNQIHYKILNPARKSFLDNNDCSWENDIQRFMLGDFSSEEEDIFKKNLSSLLKTYQESNAKIVLLTHRHRKHFEGLFNSDIYTIVNEVSKNFSNVDVFDLSLLDNDLDSSSNLSQIFPSEEIDPASHPVHKYWSDEIIPNIYDIILDNLAD